ncbi:MAG: hypothetical protein H6924_03500 [Alphaproteobacteria bacterium]|nr:hypothetical protein [Alphaproteobacteria bacterium]
MKHFRREAVDVALFNADDLKQIDTEGEGARYRRAEFATRAEPSLEELYRKTYRLMSTEILMLRTTTHHGGKLARSGAIPGRRHTVKSGGRHPGDRNRQSHDGIVRSCR